MSTLQTTILKHPDSASNNIQLDSSGRVGLNNSNPSALGTGRLVVGDGSASAETITIFSSTTGTGNIHFADGTSGQDRFRGYISYEHSSNGLAFATNDSEALRIDGSRRLLVGTSSATGTFSGITPQVRVEGTNYDTSTALIYQNSADAAAPAVLVLGKSRGPGIGASTSVIANDRCGVLEFNGADGTTRGISLGNLAGFVDGTTATNDMPGRLVFGTTVSGASTPTTRMTIHNTGEFRIGTTETAVVSTDPVHTIGDVSIPTVTTNLARLIIQDRTSNWISFKGGSGVHAGTISVSGGGVNYGSNSDYRLKENVVNLTGAITRIKQLAPKRFNFIAEPEIIVDGFLAHEAQAVVPEAVTGTHDEIAVWEDTDILPDGVSVGDNKLDENGNTVPVMQGMDHSKIVPLLTAALQEAIGKIETLEAKVAALEAG